MIDGQWRKPDPSLSGSDDPLQIRQDRLVNGAAETNARIVPEEAILRIGREPGARMEADCTGAQPRLGERSLDCPPVASANPFVSVDVKDPLPGRVVDRMVSRRGKIVLPLVIDKPGRVGSRDVPAAIAGPGIDDDDFIDEAGDLPQTAAEVFFLVANNESR
jgi:hypothetical protein